jgi:hypothetical protein
MRIIERLRKWWTRKKEHKVIPLPEGATLEQVENFLLYKGLYVFGARPRPFVYKHRPSKDGECIEVIFTDMETQEEVCKQYTFEEVFNN